MSYTFLADSESCTSSPGREEVCSAECFSDIPAFVLSRLNLTRERCFSIGSETESCPSSPYGTTFAPLTGDPGADSLTLCAAGFPAKTLAQLEKEQESAENAAGSGPKWQESFAKWDRATSSWKTPQCSLLAGLDEFSETWPKWGMMRDGECIPLPMLELSTAESAFGFSLPTIGKNEFKGTSRVRFYGSPEYRGAKMAEGVRTSKDDPIYLSPSFSEEAMMWPITWTALAPLGMDKFQQWLRSHGESWPMNNHFLRGQPDQSPSPVRSAGPSGEARPSCDGADAQIL